MHRVANDKPYLYPGDPNIAALVTDAAHPPAPLPSAHLDDTASIASLIWDLALPLDETLSRLLAAGNV